MEYAFYPIPEGVGTGVLYTYKSDTGETRDFRFPMGKAPKEFYWDYGRQFWTKVFTAPGIAIH